MRRKRIEEQDTGFWCVKFEAAKYCGFRLCENGTTTAASNFTRTQGIIMISYNNLLMSSSL